MLKNTDLYLTKFDQLLFLGDVNAGVEDSPVKTFCPCFNLASMINQTKSSNKELRKPSCIDLISTVIKTTYKKSQAKIITYRIYKYFNNESFRKELLEIEANGNNCNESFKIFTSTRNVISNKKVIQRKSITFYHGTIVRAGIACEKIFLCQSLMKFGIPLK